MSRRAEHIESFLSELPEAPLSRRAFIGGALGGALVLAVPMTAGKARAAGAGGQIGAFISIGVDEMVTIISPSAEMGQGAASGLAQLVAEELMVDWAKVKIQLGDATPAFANKLFQSQGTAGSTTIRAWYDGLRKSGAQAREMLVAAAIADTTVSGLGGAPRNAYTAARGVITNTRTGKSATYGHLATAAATLPVPANPALLGEASPRLIGQSLKRLDIPPKVDGSAVFGIDVRLPGMLHAAVRLSPKIGQTINSAGPGPSGTTIVKLKDANGAWVGIAAVSSGTTWDAMRAARSVNISWKDAAHTSATDSAKMKLSAQRLLTSGTAVKARDKGDAKTAIESAAKKISATYSAPYLAHAPMEPLNATAQVTAGRHCEIWAPTQNPSVAFATAKSITGLNDANIKVHTTYLGGAFGRKFEADFISYAVQTAMATGGKPVKVTWPREEDFSHDLYRPASLCQLSGGVDSTGRPVGITSRSVSQSIYADRGWLAPNSLDPSAVEGLLMNTGDESVAYSLGDSQFAEWVFDSSSKVPTGWWRSVGQSFNVFFLESFIDELASAAGKDPIAFRKAMLPNGSRDIEVLKRLEAESGWNTKPPTGVARGVAMARGFGGTVVGEVAEVSGSIAAGIKVRKVTVVIDCGTVINPDNVRSQVESGVIQGMAAAMWQEMPFSAGAPTKRNFGAYPMMRMSSAPAISTIIMPANGNPPSGVGEPGVPPIAPAIGNAIAALTGTRLRAMPLLPNSAPRGGDD
ncbi:MAG: molybdopterin cofactor-binding domain-containing protein [Actinomycetes bacterium]